MPITIIVYCIILFNIVVFAVADNTLGILPERKKNMVKRFEELEFKDDFMFCIIMKNPKYCKPFLETVLGVKINHIEYPSSQESIDLSLDAKSVRLDVYVEDGKGTVYNIEMQTANKYNLPKRMRYYQGIIDLNILEKGRDYRDLKKSYVIFVCTFDLFGKGRHVYTFENRCVQDLGLALGDDTVKIILNTKGTEEDVSQDMKELLDFIDGKGAGATGFIRDLEEAVQSVRKNEKWRVDYMTLQMSYQEKFEEGYERGIECGIERGIERGIEQEREELALRMVRKGELPAEKIAMYTGLSLKKIKEFQKMLQSV